MLVRPLLKGTKIDCFLFTFKCFVVTIALIPREKRPLLLPKGEATAVARAALRSPVYQCIQCFHVDLVVRFNFKLFVEFADRHGETIFKEQDGARPEVLAGKHTIFQCVAPAVQFCSVPLLRI